MAGIRLNQTCFIPSNFTSVYGICSNYCVSLSSSAPNATPEFVAPSITGNSYLDFFIGLSLAVGQSAIDAFSFLFNKKAQNRLALRGVSAAEGSFQYTLIIKFIFIICKNCNNNI